MLVYAPPLWLILSSVYFTCLLMIIAESMHHVFDSRGRPARDWVSYKQVPGAGPTWVAASWIGIVEVDAVRSVSCTSTCKGQGGY